MCEKQSKRNVRIGGGSLALTLTALLGLGCAQVSQLGAAFQTAPAHLEAQGPGTVFGSIDCAAVDALIYAYLQTQTARDTRMRAGTIYTTGEGYSYDEPVVAGPLLPDRVSYVLKPRDVARFHLYPRVDNYAENRRSEVPWKADRRSVRFVDPLHRPIYILHPSLAIREYRGGDHELVEVANLRRPARLQTLAGARPTRVYGMCHQAQLSDGDRPPMGANLDRPGRGLEARIGEVPDRNASLAAALALLEARGAERLDEAGLAVERALASLEDRELEPPPLKAPGGGEIPPPLKSEPSTK